MGTLGKRGGHGIRGLSSTEAGERTRQQPETRRIGAERGADPAPRGGALFDRSTHYEEAFQVHHDKESVRSGHLYQIVSYLPNAALARPHGPPWEGILLHPAVVDTSFRLRYRLLGHAVTIASEDLARDWKDIRAELLEFVEEGGDAASEPEGATGATMTDGRRSR